MGGFANTIMNILLGWMRALINLVWGIIESPGASGVLSWFVNSWWLFALLLIAAGLVIDWLIWLIRWQPYHIWATRLRHLRRFFARMAGRSVEVVEPVGYGTMQYAPAQPTYFERRQDARAGYGASYAQEDPAFLEEDDFSEDGFSEDDFADGDFVQEAYVEDFAEEDYAQGDYAQAGYAQQGYVQPGFAQESYARGSFVQGSHAQVELEEEAYAEEELVEEPPEAELFGNRLAEEAQVARNVYTPMNYWDDDVAGVSEVDGLNAAQGDALSIERNGVRTQEEPFGSKRAIHVDPFDDPHFDPHASYRRPLPEQFSPSSIPDSRLGDYPGKRYDPNKLPQMPYREAYRDPLAAYDAYQDDAPAQEYDIDREERAHFPASDVVAQWPARRPRRRDEHHGVMDREPGEASEADGAIARKGDEATPPLQEDCAPGRRQRRRRLQQSSATADLEDTETPPRPKALEDPLAASAPPIRTDPARRRVPRKAGPVISQGVGFEPLDTPARAETIDEEPIGRPRDDADAAYDDWQEENFDADDLPAPPKWSQWNAGAQSRGGGNRPKLTLLTRVLKPSDKPESASASKKRGVLAQMLDPQVDSIKGLPPRVEARQAFHKPTYPQQYDPTQGDGSGQWDDDT